VVFPQFGFPTSANIIPSLDLEEGVFESSELLSGMNISQDKLILMRSASFFRIEIRDPRTEISMGSPKGARRINWIRVPGNKPSSRKRVMDASPLGMDPMTAKAPCSKSLKQDEDDIRRQWVLLGLNRRFVDSGILWSRIPGKALRCCY
jgi:hypothetical protein